jgi:hypothetical protein
LDIATASSFAVCADFGITNKSSAHPFFVGPHRRSIVRSSRRRRCHQQSIRIDADHMRARCRSQRTVPTSHRQPLRPARPYLIRHQISTKQLERCDRSSRKNDRPAKTINTSTRPRTHRREQLSQRTM